MAYTDGPLGPGLPGDAASGPDLAGLQEALDAHGAKVDAAKASAEAVDAKVEAMKTDVENMSAAVKDLVALVRQFLLRDED